MADHRLLRKKVRWREQNSESDMAVTEHEEVHVSCNVDTVSNKNVLSDANEHTIKELRDEGRVLSLFLADALLNRLRQDRGRRWTPQVLVFHAYFLSLSGVFQWISASHAPF